MILKMIIDSKLKMEQKSKMPVTGVFFSDISKRHVIIYELTAWSAKHVAKTLDR